LKNYIQFVQSMLFFFFCVLEIPVYLKEILHQIVPKIRINVHPLILKDNWFYLIKITSHGVLIW